MAQTGSVTANVRFPDGCKLWHLYLVILLFAGAIYLGCIVSPPSLMDDVDAVHAQIARTMLTSGDWVTSRIDGVPYFEKAPAVYWAIAISYKIFGVHDWSARIPIALAAIALCWLTAAFGVWAFGKRAGFYAGLCLSTCIGLFLFTRILIPDVMLTFTTALAMWAFLRIVEEEEPRSRLWAALLAASLGVGLLLKSLIAVVFPVGAAIVYLLITHQLFSARIWKAAAFFQRRVNRPGDCCALAHSCDDSEPSVFCVYAAQRSGPLSRVPVVFRHQRATVAVSGPAFPARLQYRSAPLLLALSPDLAFSLERLFSGGRETFVQAG